MLISPSYLYSVMKYLLVNSSGTPYSSLMEHSEIQVIIQLAIALSTQCSRSLLPTPLGIALFVSQHRPHPLFSIPLFFACLFCSRSAISQPISHISFDRGFQLLIEILDPSISLQERIVIAYVIHYDNGITASVVILCQRSESLLSCCIPQLDLDLLTTHTQYFGFLNTITFIHMPHPQYSSISQQTHCSNIV